MNPNIKTRLKRWLLIFLGIDPMFVRDVEAIKAELKRVNRNIEDIVNKAIIGADLGYRDSSQVIIIQYSRLTNSFKVVADTNSQFLTYNEFVNKMRHVVNRYNAETVVIDAHNGVSKADLLGRILPDKGITGRYKERL